MKRSMLSFSQQQQNYYYSNISKESYEICNQIDNININYNNNYDKKDASLNKINIIDQGTTTIGSALCEFSCLLLSSPSSIKNNSEPNSIRSNDNYKLEKKERDSTILIENEKNGFTSSKYASDSEKNLRKKSVKKFEIIDKINNNSTNNTKENNNIKKKFSPLLTSTNVESRFLKLFRESTTSSTVNINNNNNNNNNNRMTEIKTTKEMLNRIAEDNSYLSEFEERILKSTSPLPIRDENGVFKIELNQNLRGFWLNKNESDGWNGDIPLNQYQINEDDDPCVITKTTKTKLEYIQEMAVRYLQPPTPPVPGDIIIEQRPNKLTPPAPPLVIRQAPARPVTPEPLIIREMPPKLPPKIGKKVITIYGKNLPPPPRKVVIERFAPLPPKPQSVIIERWLPFKQHKRRVILQKNPVSDPIIQKPKNYIIQWEPPKIEVKRKVTYLPIIRADPNDYVKKYGSSLMHASQMPTEILNIKNPKGIVLAAEVEKQDSRYELEGDIDALNLIDLDEEGLSEYKDYIKPKSAILRPDQKEVGIIASPIAGTMSTPTSNLTSITNLSSSQNNQLGYTKIQSKPDNHIYQNKSLDSTVTPPSTISCKNASVIKFKSPDITLGDGTVVDETSLMAAIDEIFNHRQINGFVSFQETLNVLLRLDKSIGKNLGENTIMQVLSVYQNQKCLIDSKAFKYCFQKVLL